jgi:hypothetical protein
VSSPILNAYPQPPASQSSPCLQQDALFMSPFIWHAWGRAVPKEWLTGEMFAAQKRDRVLMISKKLITNSNVSIVATGESLFQYDVDVFMLVAHQGRKGEKISFRIRDFVQDLHEKPQRRKRRAPEPGTKARSVNSVGGKSIISALESIMRLQGFSIEMRVDRGGSFDYGYSGRLIDEAALTINGMIVPLNDEAMLRGQLADAVVDVTLDSKLATLFEKDRLTFISPSVRCKLGTSPLALWLYAFVEAVGRPFDLPLAYYLSHSGSSSRPGEFKRLMTNARNRVRHAKQIHSSRIAKGRLRIWVKKSKDTAAAKAPIKRRKRIKFDDAPEF